MTQPADAEQLMADALDLSLEARAHRLACSICRPRYLAGGALCPLGERLADEARRAWRAYDRAPSRPRT